MINKTLLILFSVISLILSTALTTVSSSAIPDGVDQAWEDYKVYLIMIELIYYYLIYYLINLNLG